MSDPDLIAALNRAAAAQEASAQAQQKLARNMARNTRAVLRLCDEAVTLATMLAPDPEERDADAPPTHDLAGRPITTGQG